MKRQRVVLGLLVTVAVLLAGCGGDDVTAVAEREGINLSGIYSLPFYEDFANNKRGWGLGPEWQIGAAMGHTPVNGNSDPATDTSPSADNGIAGVIIGGDYLAEIEPTGPTYNLHPFHYLTSPIIDASGATTLTLAFQRWLNSDYQPYVTNSVEVYDGSTWVPIWQSGVSPSIFDPVWMPQSFDISPFANGNLRVRFGFDIASNGVFAAGGWNVDDVAVY